MFTVRYASISFNRFGPGNHIDPTDLVSCISDATVFHFAILFWILSNLIPTDPVRRYRGGLKCCHGGTLITNGAAARAALVAENDTDYYQTLYR